MFAEIKNSHGAPVALGDMKLHHIQTTVRETGLYCSTSCSAQSGLASPLGGVAMAMCAAVNCKCITV